MACAAENPSDWSCAVFFCSGRVGGTAFGVCAAATASPAAVAWPACCPQTGSSWNQRIKLPASRPAATKSFSPK